jgi:transposase
LRAARRLFPFVEVIFADGAYRGEATAKAVAGTGRWRLEIVSRGDAEGFVPLAERWIVLPCTMLPRHDPPHATPTRKSLRGLANLPDGL